MANLGRPSWAGWIVCWAALVLGGCGSDEEGGSEDTTDTDSGGTGGGSSQASGGGSGEAGQPTALGQLAINELMPSNHVTIQDEGQAFADWVELYNPTAEDLDLGG
jgi:hypothetical protein